MLYFSASVELAERCVDILNVKAERRIEKNKESY